MHEPHNGQAQVQTMRVAMVQDTENGGAEQQNPKMSGSVVNPLIVVYWRPKRTMKQFVQLHCRYCQSDDLVKNGHSENGTQRYRCKSCNKSFQLTYSYNAWKPGTKDQIDEMTLNSSGVRDIGRTLKISPNTVVRHLKKNDPKM